MGPTYQTLIQFTCNGTVSNWLADSREEAIAVMRVLDGVLTPGAFIEIITALDASWATPATRLVAACFGQGV